MSQVWHLGLSGVRVGFVVIREGEQAGTESEPLTKATRAPATTSQRALGDQISAQGSLKRSTSSSF